MKTILLLIYILLSAIDIAMGCLMLVIGSNTSMDMRFIGGLILVNGFIFFLIFNGVIRRKNEAG